MAKTLATIRTQVRSFLDETNAADWTNTELDVLINTAYHRVATAVMAVFEDYYITTDLFNTTANQEEYGSADGVATNIFKIRRVEVNFDVSNANSAPTRCLPVNMDEVRRDLGFRNAGVGVYAHSAGAYYTYGFGSNFKIGILPHPDKTGTDAGKIWYIKTLADLASSSDEVDIPYADRFWMLIAYGATADALRFGQQDSPEADKFDQKLAAGLILMQEELEDKVAEEVKTVQDTSGEIMDFEI